LVGLGSDPTKHPREDLVDPRIQKLGIQRSWSSNKDVGAILVDSKLANVQWFLWIFDSQKKRMKGDSRRSGT